MEENLSAPELLTSYRHKMDIQHWSIKNLILRSIFLNQFEQNQTVVDFFRIFLVIERIPDGEGGLTVLGDKAVLE